MCGICGIVDFGNTDINNRIALVGKMNDAIIHRGPDGEGRYNDSIASLAMRRLSIIDLVGGDQPIWNADRSICLFMNGEIYNYKELKNVLLSRGHRFYTNSDTEVLLHMYEEYGLKMVSELRGMFAFCIYEVTANKFHFGRDRFGEKPFYYYYNEGRFSYSSEVTSLLQDDKVDRVINIEALDYYLASAFVPEPLTLIKDVHTLLPGHTLTLTKEKLEIRQYFQIDYSNGKEKISNVEEAKTYLEPYLRTAIDRQLVSDVPVGAFLSGGIDSSTICAILQANSDTPIDTFTARFEESTYDESLIAREVAKHIGSNHHEVTISNNEFSEEMFWKIIDHVGLPFADSSAIPTYEISKEISKYVTVAISGDGGDEIFAGYSMFDWWKKIDKVSKVPKFIRKLGIRALDSNLIPIESVKVRKIKRGLTASMKGQKFISTEIYRKFFDDELEELLKDGFHSDFDIYTELPELFNTWSPLRKAMYHRLRHNLVDDMLVKVDRMSMANSLEVRAPFLDPDLYEASLNISDDLLMYDGVGKKIIRDIMKPHLPDIVFNHPKSGFSIPLHKFINDEYYHLVDTLIDRDSSIYHLFDEEVLLALKNNRQHKDSKKTSAFRTSHQQWSMLLLFGWVKRFNIKYE